MTVITRAVQDRAEQHKAFWLLNIIETAQAVDKVGHESFQVWHLAVADDHSATVTCDDGDDNVVYTQAIRYTDYPKPGIKLYFQNNTIMLPEDY